MTPGCFRVALDSGMRHGWVANAGLTIYSLAHHSTGPLRPRQLRHHVIITGRLQRSLDLFHRPLTLSGRCAQQLLDTAKRKPAANLVAGNLPVDFDRRPESQRCGGDPLPLGCGENDGDENHDPASRRCAILSGRNSKTIGIQLQARGGIADHCGLFLVSFPGRELCIVLGNHSSEKACGGRADAAGRCVFDARRLFRLYP